jgi:transposase
MLRQLPRTKLLAGDKGYDSDAFRKTLPQKGIEPCILPKRAAHPHPYGEALYKKRHKIENSFAWIKDWRRIATRYDRRAHLLLKHLRRRQLHLPSALIRSSDGEMAICSAFQSGMPEGTSGCTHVMRHRDSG